MRADDDGKGDNVTSQRYDDGLRIRKAVLGAAHVNAALDSEDFTSPMQRLVTEYCWGAVWSRPGLPLKVRSLLNLSMLAVLNRSHEFKVHIKGALRNGCTREEITETLLQAAVYGGVPAGMESFRLAAQAIVEYESEMAADGATS